MRNTIDVKMIGGPMDGRLITSYGACREIHGAGRDRYKVVHIITASGVEYEARYIGERVNG